MIYYSLTQTLGALKAVSVYYIPPVVGLATGAIFAGESFSLKQTAGALAVAASHQAPEIKESRMCSERTAAFGSSDHRLKRKDLGAKQPASFASVKVGFRRDGTISGLSQNHPIPAVAANVRFHPLADTLSRFPLFCQKETVGQ